MEVVKDGLSVSEMLKLSDQILFSLNECNKEGIDYTSNTQALETALSTLSTDARWDHLEENEALAVLAHKMSLIYVAARWSGLNAKTVAARNSSRALRIFSTISSNTEVDQWRQQVNLIHRTMFNDVTDTPATNF